MIDFETARTIVTKATGHKTEQFGWENDDVFLVPIDWGDEFPELDAPTRLVNKETGKLHEVYGLGVMGIDAAPDLRPIGDAPGEKSVMQVVTKSIEAAVKPVESEHPNGQAEVILSTEGLDRDGENLWIKEWKTPLPKRIHIDGDHGRSLDKTVGSCAPRIEGNKMVGLVDFAGTPYGQMVRQLVNEGHVDKLSVTYGETKDKDGNIQRELFNAAFVAIPANPEAVVLASKAAKLEEKADGGMGASGNNPEVKHDDMVQAIHDAAAHLGAQCMNMADADPGTADGANKSVDEVTDKETSDTSCGCCDKCVAGSPKKSADESAAAETAEKSAVSAAAEDSADDTAAIRAKEAEKARGLAFLISMNTRD